MFQLAKNASASDVLSAMDRSQAIIEFDLEGTIVTANENFLKAVEYDLAEIVGRQHSMFLSPDEAASGDYKAFWASLCEGEFMRGQYKRVGKNGKEIWIEASYNPVRKRGKVIRIVKFATDITASKLRSAEDAGKLSALSRAQAIIEFSPGGEILTANKNFLDALGYRLEEIIGKHHSMFCEQQYAQHPDYERFWKTLAAGDFISDEFKRIGKGGKAVYIQASYNPIFDMSGRVTKVVKFATDISERVRAVAELGEGLRQLSGGDLTINIDRAFLPSLDSLRTDYNGSVLKLRDAVLAILVNAKRIGEASQAMKSASDDLARRTEQQAASVEQTAAALEEIATTVADSSRRATEAGSLVQQARSKAEGSGALVADAKKAMQSIDASSHEIGTIIGVIDEIAFQTTLLALNAGVEAARAGDAGKGFAVVAQEVRELAQRSGNAARDIKALVLKSNEEVKRGVALVNETGSALTSIVSEVREIDRHVSDIVQAAQEQALGMKDINSAINSIDQNTQQNASMVEGTAALAREISDSAHGLEGQIAAFRTEGGFANSGFGGRRAAA